MELSDRVSDPGRDSTGSVGGGPLPPRSLRSALRGDVIALGSFLRRNGSVVTILAAATSLVVAAPHTLFGEIHYGSLVYYGLIPLALGLGLRFRPRELGLGLGSVRDWLPLTLLYLAIFLPLDTAAALSPAIRNYYVAQPFDPFTALWTTAVYLIGWEFLFRGFLLFGLKKHLGETAILIQMIPFTLAHLGKPEVETLSCIISGIWWGYVCYRGESFWPAVLMHLAVNYYTSGLLAYLTS